MTKQLRTIRDHRLFFAFLLVVILATAAFLRIWRISEYLTFLGDEGRDVLVVKRIIVDHKLTLLGPTASVGGFFLGPIYYYMMVPFLWAWKLDPTGPAVMVALLGICTVYLVYLLGSRMYSKFTGIAAAALYAVSPVVIAQSRSSWNPNVVPFFAALLFYFSWLVSFSADSRLPLFLIGIFLGIGIQLHYVFLFLFVSTALWLVFLVYLKKIPFKQVWLVVVGFLLSFSPFIAFELRHGFQNTVSIITFLLQGKDTGFSLATFFGNIVNVFVRLFGRLVLRMPDKYMLQSMPAVMEWLTLGLSFVIGMLAFANGAVSVKRSIEQRSGSGKTQKQIPVTALGHAYLMLTLTVVIFLFGLYKRDIYDYYFGIVFVIPFLLTVSMIEKLKKLRTGYILPILILAGLCAYNLLGQPFQYEPNNQLGQTKRIARAALDAAGGKAFNFALVAPLNSDHAYKYFFEIWGNPPKAIENAVIDPQRKSVMDQLIVICETIDCKPLGHPLWEIAGFGRAEIAGTWNVPFVTIYKLVRYEEPNQQ